MMALVWNHPKTSITSKSKLLLGDVLPDPTVLHFVTEVYKLVHISVTEWCIVGYVWQVYLESWERIMVLKLIEHLFNIGSGNGLVLAWNQMIT